MPNHDLLIFRNDAVDPAATGGLTQTDCEVTATNNGRNVFLTGNRFASKSANSGTTWRFVDPVFVLQPPASGGFWGDQTTIYEPRRDLTIWALMYHLLGNTNTVRIAVNQSPDFT